jgi:hypothetical protein
MPQNCSGAVDQLAPADQAISNGLIDREGKYAMMRAHLV